MKIIFFSDAHLGSNGDHSVRRKKVKQFLQSMIGNTDQLVINGDLFDFWFEYKHVIPKGNLDILSLLYQLGETGTRIDYICGNHDFWMHDYLREELGIHIHKDEFSFTAAGKKFWVFHGDGLAKKDVGYRILKKIFRFGPNIWLYRWLHPDLGVPLAKKISHTSRESSQYKDLQDEQDYIDYALEKMGAGFDYVILGHRHQPQMEEFDGKKYINLGDWIHHYTYAEFNGTDLYLKSFDQ